MSENLIAFVIAAGLVLTWLYVMNLVMNLPDATTDIEKMRAVLAPIYWPMWALRQVARGVRWFVMRGIPALIADMRNPKAIAAERRVRAESVCKLAEAYCFDPVPEHVQQQNMDGE